MHIVAGESKVLPMLDKESAPASWLLGLRMKRTGHIRCLAFESLINDGRRRRIEWPGRDPREAPQSLVRIYRAKPACVSWHTTSNVGAQAHLLILLHDA